MGQLKFRQPLTMPGINVVIPKTSTAAIIANRVIKYSSVGNVKHTTGSSGRISQGVALNSATGGGKRVMVGIFGVFDIYASSRAIAAGSCVRPTSGSASTATQLGGTVRQTTVAMTTALPVRANVLGIALTSCAAAATLRTVKVLVNQTWNNPALS